MKIPGFTASASLYNSCDYSVSQNLSIASGSTSSSTSHSLIPMLQMADPTEESFGGVHSRSFFMFLERADAIFESDISGSGGRHESGGGDGDEGESGTVNKQHCLPECGPCTRRSDLGEGLWQRCITKDCGIDFVPCEQDNGPHGKIIDVRQN